MYKRLRNFIFKTILLIFFVIIGCRQEINTSNRDITETYCATCHLRPNPHALTKEVWQKHVLPKMGVRLGVKTTFEDMRYEKVLRIAGVAADTQLISYEDWSLIQEYYLKSAPDFLIIERKLKPSPNTLFSAKSIPTSCNLRSTSLIHYNQKNDLLFIGDGLNFNLYQFDHKFQIQDSISYSGAPSFMLEDNVLTMGNMPPHDQTTGLLSTLKNEPIISNLRRPVHFTKRDLDNDQDEDFVICSFGNNTGDLSFFETKKDTIIRHVLIKEAGSIKAEVIDLDGDLQEDILVLMAQGREGFYWFKNMGNSTFSTKKTIIEFPPSHGSSYFQLADINNDGKQDILYCNGDNGDYPAILKPYHGIHIILNESEQEHIHFNQSQFIPYPGVYKAFATDYDQDGDLDIAAISYFPDYSVSELNSFSYFENVGDMNYKKTLVDGTDLGKWLVMEEGDFDKDGDIDLLLGHSNMMLGDVDEEMKTRWDKEKTNLMLLENQRIKKE